MKIYTRTGDDGTTGLFGGERAQKNHPRIEVYGTVDELNALLGVVRSLLESETEKVLDASLAQLQSELFELGADLATPLGTRVKVKRMNASHITAMEKTIDTFEEPLTELKYFILPGGTPVAAMLHLARTTCRRAERHVVAAAKNIEFTPHAKIYLNRLSDLLFVLARWANHTAHVSDEVWKPRDS